MLRSADHDADLTRVKGRKGIAAGQPIQVIGRIVDLHGNPVRNAEVELWQCNAAGRYDHPGDRGNPAALDPNFQGFARLATNSDGEFRFRSVKPKDYDTPIGRRTPHVHSRTTVTTSHCDPGEPGGIPVSWRLAKAAWRTEALVVRHQVGEADGVSQ
jgi:protocatechuate 3,4-dioxygenase beta subunit